MGLDMTGAGSGETAQRTRFMIVCVIFTYMPQVNLLGPVSLGRAPPDGMDAEEAERCPICLGVLAGAELAVPDSCCHVFCLRCLLTWAEVE